MSNEFKELKSEGERWDSKVIPERWMEEFREMSPGTTYMCGVCRQVDACTLYSLYVKAAKYLYWLKSFYMYLLKFF